MDKQDQRYKRAEATITCTFLECMRRIGFAKITVKEIVECAHINRSTFYAHYNDKYELIDCIENNLLNSLAEKISSIPIEEAIADEGSITFAIMTYAKSLTDFLQHKGALFALLVGENGRPEFIVKFNKLVLNMWSDMGITERLTIPPNYAYAVFSGLITNLIMEWVKSDFKETDEEFIQIAMSVTRGIPSKLFKKIITTNAN